MREPYATITLYMIETGCRVSDVLAIPRYSVDCPTMSVCERKTGKTREVSISRDLYDRIIALGGGQYAFDRISRHRGRAPITRQLYDYYLRKACALVRLRASAHSMRHLYARELYKVCKSVDVVQTAMMHSSPRITMRYIRS
jgi:integrase